MRCRCGVDAPHDARLVVLTGGPGAGKTALLEVVRRHFCEHVEVLPEAASILFGGGFPRRASKAGQRGAQVAIFHVQRQLEAIAKGEERAAIALCDRGTLDGLAYWPAPSRAYWSATGTDLATELARYACVIHLRTPRPERGYDQSNPVRIESAAEALALDRRIEGAWADHPRRFFVEDTASFITKLARAVELIRAELPPCCRAHRVPEAEKTP